MHVKGYGDSPATKYCVQSVSHKYDDGGKAGIYGREMYMPRIFRCQ